LVPALVSLMTKAEPVPAFVSAKPVALPLFAIVNEVGVDKPDAKVKPMLRPSVVRIVFPESYACCRVTFNALAGHWTTSLVTSSRQRVVAVLVVVFRELNCVVDPRMISPVPLGERFRFSFDVVAMVGEVPLKVRSPLVVIAPDESVPLVTTLPLAVMVKLEVPLV